MDGKPSGSGTDGAMADPAGSAGRRFATLRALFRQMTGTDDRGALLHEACRVLTDHGGFAAAWVRSPDSAALAAWAGPALAWAPRPHTSPANASDCHEVPIPINGRQPALLGAYRAAASDPAGDSELLDDVAGELAFAIKNLSRGLDALRDLIEGVEACIAVVWADGTLEFENRALAAHARGDGEANLGARLSPASARRVRLYGMAEACRQGYWRGEGELLHADGPPLPVTIELLAPSGIDRGRRYLALIRSRSCRAQPAPRVAVRAGEDLRILEPACIGVLLACSHHTEVYTTEGVFLADQPLVSLERRLAQAHFLRTHRRYLVNLEKVSAVLRTGPQMELRVTGVRHPVPVSRRHGADLRRALGL